jgi:hypothetical protein
MFWRTFSSVLILVGSLASVRGDITVEGIQDKQVVSDHISFRIVPAAGSTDAASLNGADVAGGVWVEVNQPDFYELRVERTPQGGGVPEVRVIRFIVRASERGDTERGLPPWTPYPNIPSAAAEFSGAELHLVTPARLPAGLELPIIVRVQRPDGSLAGVNGLITSEGFPGLALRRGIGSIVAPLPTTNTPVTYAAQVGDLTARREIVVDTNTTWTTISGTLSGSAVWPENARIHVVSNLLLTADADLRIGAGAVVQLAPGAEIRLTGKLRVEGAVDNPVLFTSESRSRPWGGFVLRTNSALLEMTGAILTGAGADPDWFDSHPGSGSSHRQEQPLIYLSDGARAALTNCYLISNQGQAAHGENGLLSLIGCLVQRCVTTGQFNGGSVQFKHSAFLEFPIDDDVFADDDNDAMYFTEGTHSISDCLIGWAKDDGIDAGSGGAGEVTVERCWIESCYHEGLAWSGTGRIARSRDTVILNCGQGVEAGWNSPDVLAEHCLCVGNLVGARFGDNYDWTYDGLLRVTNSFLLFNYRNVWGRQWDDWTERLDRMNVQGNFLSAPDPNHPANSLWTAEDGVRLSPFVSAPPESAVGIGFATRTGQLALSALTNAIPVGLSRFATQLVTVEYVAETARETLATGSIQFLPGETVKSVRLSIPDLPGHHWGQLRLQNPTGGVVTGSPLLFVADSAPSLKLISRGTEWKYLDTGVEAPQDWRALSFDDAAWKNGSAELGFGDGDEATVINGGPSDDRYPAVYFRRLFSVSDPAEYSRLTVSLRRDDGALVYLNGQEIFRSNLPTGPVAYGTWALSSSTSETTFYAQDVEPALLVSGTNVLAVEVHQANKTSSDLSFDLELTATPQPRLQFETTSDGMLWLSWPDPAFRLEEAEAVTGPWRERLDSSTAVPVKASATRFFRLHNPLP